MLGKHEVGQILVVFLLPFFLWVGVDLAQAGAWHPLRGSLAGVVMLLGDTSLISYDVGKDLHLVDRV